MGRLRRDKRMVGLFPSNFVKVLPDDFQPVSRQSSPMPASGVLSGSASATPHSPAVLYTPQKSKSMFRKPFTAYAASDPSLQGKNVGMTPSPSGSTRSSRPKPYSSMKAPLSNVASPSPSPRPSPVPTIPAPIARANSPCPSGGGSRRQSRAPSPMPPIHQSRRLSPMPNGDLQSPLSSPPPPPPTHGVLYSPSRAPSPLVNMDGYANASHSSVSPYGSVRGNTPSPFRDAMNDVMSSLDVMGSPERSENNLQPVDIWSPEAFNEVYSMSARTVRAHTPSETRHGHRRSNRSAHDSPSRTQQYDDSQHGDSPRLGTYVERMENRLRQIHIDDESHEAWAREDDGPDTESSFPKQKLRPLHKTSLSLSNLRPASTFDTSRRSKSSHAQEDYDEPTDDRPCTLKSQRSNFELGAARQQQRLGRSLTTRSSVTNASSTAHSTSTSTSNSTQLTSQSLMSGYSAGGFSATSAGSLARRRWGRSNSVKNSSQMETLAKQMTSNSSTSHQSGYCIPYEPSLSSSAGGLGGFSTPIGEKKKKGFFKKLLDSAKSGSSSSRSVTTVTQSERPTLTHQKSFNNGVESISGGYSQHGGYSEKSAAREMGLGSNTDCVQMRRDVNRANSLSRMEKTERADRAEMLGVQVINPIDLLAEAAEGDEGSDGMPVVDPTDFTASNLAQIDKTVRFIHNLPAVVSPGTLATGYVCRPYRSDVQRLRAIFTWAAERITWEEDFEGEVDARRVVQTKRGCSKEIAFLVVEMCEALGLVVEAVEGYLKSPADAINGHEQLGIASTNHWWNAVIVDGEWRIMDCSLANPSNPKRREYSDSSMQVAESWLFLVRPLEICYTHIPILPEQQHIVPTVQQAILAALPAACPPYFKNQLHLWDFDTSQLQLDGLEVAHIHLEVPEEVECVAEVEARSFARDADGDLFESGDMERTRALAQAEFVSCPDAEDRRPFKRYTIKALLPSSASASNQAVLKIYAGRRGLIHSINSNPHPLALALPLSHQGLNPEFSFLTRHPTPHALRHEIYVVGPLCKRLAVNNTFVFAVRQHPASPSSAAVSNGPGRPAMPSRPSSALSIARPSSAMSMHSVSMSGSAYSNPSNSSSETSGRAIGGGASGASLQHHHVKPAKLALQSPSGKILRMTRKLVPGLERGDGAVEKVGSSWEAIVKIGERGTWRGLVLADRSARWCVFGEWECV